MKILFAGSSGGHLAQLMTLQPWWQHHQRIWMTFDTPDARSRLEKEKVIWLHHSPERDVADVARSAYMAARWVKRLRPDVIVSAGASLGTLAIAAGRIMGIPSIYIEVFDRIDIASLSGKICYRIATDFAVQWEEQRRLYPHAHVIGPLL